MIAPGWEKESPCSKPQNIPQLAQCKSCVELSQRLLRCPELCLRAVGCPLWSSATRLAPPPVFTAPAEQGFSSQTKSSRLPWSSSPLEMLVACCPPPSTLIALPIPFADVPHLPWAFGSLHHQSPGADLSLAARQGWLSAQRHGRFSLKYSKVHYPVQPTPTPVASLTRHVRGGC